MTQPLRFHTNPMSRGRIVRWMLEECGAAYDTTVVQYGPPMKTPEYLALNPMGKVPVIEHGGVVVSECAAICAYLADAFPDAGLAPANDARGDYYRWLFFAAGPLEQAITNQSMGFVVPADRRGMAGYGSLELTVDALETALRGKRYLANDRFSAADVYVGAQLGWGLQFNTVPSRPAFADYVQALHARPAYLRARALDDALMPKPA